MDKININIMQGGEYSHVPGCGVDDNYYEISKDEYERITAIKDYASKLDAEFRENASDSILYGYGFYGCRLVRTETGRYFYVTSIGNSCD